MKISRVAEAGSLSARAKMATKVFVMPVFAIFATDASFSRVIANLVQHNMQHVTCNSAPLAQSLANSAKIATNLNVVTK